MERRVEAAVDFTMDYGMTIKKMFYNIMYDHGVYLPSFTSNCVTLASLDNARHPDEFYVYFCVDLKAELCEDEVLLAPIELVYDFIQRFHVEHHKRPLPFQTTPPASFLKPILRNIDPENKMLFLKKSWKHQYRSDLVQVGNHVFVYEPAQGQKIQKIIDQELNNALRLQNMLIGINIQNIEVERNITHQRNLIPDAVVEKLNKVDKYIFTTPNALDVYERMVANILDIEVEDDTARVEEAVEAAMVKDYNQSDAGEDPDTDANLQNMEGLFGQAAGNSNLTAPGQSTAAPTTAQSGHQKSKSGGSRGDVTGSKKPRGRGNFDEDNKRGG